ncbi:hypothetical protein [Streptomyces chartreusis]|uniref:hypothetical protein n=1 Tax=Streptomyces chartreusis TaxID=1969 RepID=UPI002E17FD52
MIDASHRAAATEGTWLIPLLPLAPSVAVRVFTDLSPGWLATGWLLCLVSLLLAVAGWFEAFRGSLRRATGWHTCLILHCVLLWQMGALAVH